MVVNTAQLNVKIAHTCSTYQFPQRGSEKNKTKQKKTKKNSHTCSTKQFPQRGSYMHPALHQLHHPPVGTCAQARTRAHLPKPLRARRTVAGRGKGGYVMGEGSGVRCREGPRWCGICGASRVAGVPGERGGEEGRVSA